MDLTKEKVDAVWSYGAVHHIRQKGKSFGNMGRILKRGGRAVIGDVFVGSRLAQHFDAQVAKYCVVGHEVSFLSREYAKTLCELNGFEKPEFHEIAVKWRFKKKADIGLFLYKLHAMTKTTPKECLRGAEEFLGINRKGGFFELNWPITFFITRKRK